MHLKQHLFPFLLYQCYLLQSFPIIFIQVIHTNIKEIKINNKTLTYKINCTRLACKIQCEHTEYTTTLIDEKTCNEIKLLDKSLREEEKKKKKKRQAPHNLAYVVSANIALAKKHYIYCIVDIVFTSIKCV